METSATSRDRPSSRPPADEPWRDPEQQPYIAIEKVTKKFGDFVAVNGVDLNIYKKELFCLLGGSGCGKTTLLRMLAGFEQPTSGRILIDGQDMAGIPPYERPVNMMFQSYALFPHMNVSQNIAFGLKQDRLPRAEVADRVEEALALVQMSDFAKRKPNQLSGGQRQRIALARALVKRPKLLLLDEPLSALDKKLREETQFELMNIQEEVGITFVVVTHDQEEAMTLSTRIAVMNKGEVEQVGTPTEIYEYPGNRFVAQFIGTINIFNGQVTAMEGDSAHVACKGLEPDLLVEHAGNLRVGQSVGIAVRPEKLTLSKSPREGAANQVKGMVTDLGYLGSLSVYRVTLENGQQVQAVAPNILRSTEREIDWDDEVYISWSSSSAVVLTD